MGRLPFCCTGFTTRRHFSAELRHREAQQPVGKVPKGIRQIGIHIGGEAVEGEVGVRIFRSIRHQPPPPYVGRQFLKCPRR